MAGSAPAAPPLGRVLVVGSTNVDRTVAVPRLPGPGETSLGGELRVSQGGKGANAAVAAARAGATVTFVSAVGRDGDGDSALDALREAGVGVERVTMLDGISTGAALIVTDAAGANLIAVAAGANGRLTADQVLDALDGLGARDVVLVSAEIPDAAVEAAVRAGLRRGATVILDPAPARSELLEVARAGAILTPNESEATALTGCGDVATAARRLSKLARRPAIVTLGASGCLVADGDAVHAHRAVAVARIVDSVGAGDAFAGGLAAALALGGPLDGAVTAALEAAATSLGHPGARPPG